VGGFFLLATVPSPFLTSPRTSAFLTRTPSPGTALLAPPVLSSPCNISLQVACLDQLLDFVLEGRTFSYYMTMTTMIPVVLTLVGILGRYAPLWLLNEVGTQSFLKDVRPAGIEWCVLCEPLRTGCVPESWGVGRPIAPSPLALLTSRILSQFFYLHKLSSPWTGIVHVGRGLHGQTVCERPRPKHCDQVCHCYFR